MARKERRRGFPRAAWGGFPLSELVVGLALVCGVAGVLSLGSRRGGWLLLAAVVLGSLAGYEVCLREHLAGRRQHTLPLAAAPAAGIWLALILAGMALPGFVLGGLALGLGVVAWTRVWWRRAGPPA